MSSSPQLVTTAGTFSTSQAIRLWDWVVYTAQDLGHFIWDAGLLILYGMWFIIQLVFYTIAFTMAWYIGTLLYQFLTHRDFALQCKFYFGPHPQNQQQQQGVLTITLIMVQGGCGHGQPPQLVGYI